MDVKEFKGKYIHVYTKGGHIFYGKLEISDSDEAAGCIRLIVSNKHGVREFERKITTECIEAAYVDHRSSIK